METRFFLLYKRIIVGMLTLALGLGVCFSFLFPQSAKAMSGDSHIMDHGAHAMANQHEAGTMLCCSEASGASSILQSSVSIEHGSSIFFTIFEAANIIAAPDVSGLTMLAIAKAPPGVDELRSIFKKE